MQKSIVVIDDNRTIQATLSTMLSRHGYDVHIGQNASQGRKKVTEVKPDLVLLDLGLPDVDGLDVLRELKAEQPELAIIVLTANDSLANAIECIKQGAFHFLAKPYAVEELLSLCTRALDQRALVRETAALRGEKEVLQAKLRVAHTKRRSEHLERRAVRAVDRADADHPQIRGRGDDGR